MTKQRKNNPKTTEIQPKNNRPKQAMRMRMKMRMKKRNSLTGVKKADLCNVGIRKENYRARFDKKE